MRPFGFALFFMEKEMLIDNIISQLKNNDEFIVISHISPDGDTLGSAAALCGILSILGKKCIHVCDGEPSYNLGKIPQLTQYIDDAKTTSVAIAVDCADKARLGCYAEIFDGAAVKIVIDHHKTNIGYGDINYIRDYPACAQCICDIIDRMGIKITHDIALCLYVAFLTDTGRFAYKGITSRTMECVASLYDFGLDIDRINRKLFNVRSFSKSKLIAKTLDNMQAWFDGKVMAAFLDYENYLTFNTGDCDTEGVVNFVLDVEGCKIAIFAHESKKGITKISLRSTDSNFDVAKVAVNFGGGGHTMAAGCTLNVPCQDAKEKIYSYIKEILF